MDLFSNPDTYIEIEIEDGQVIYYESFFEPDEADKLFKKFRDEIDWKQDHINMFGNEIPLPRKTAWYGDQGKSYIYSGIKNEPSEWTNTLLDVKERVESKCDNSFNSLLMNKYKDGKDKLSWHADDEPELDPTCSIASISFGSERDFAIKHKTKTEQKKKFPLHHGSLLIMKPPMQQFWLHQVPPRPNINQVRINLTFRYINIPDA